MTTGVVDGRVKVGTGVAEPVETEEDTVGRVELPPELLPDTVLTVFWTAVETAVEVAVVAEEVRAAAVPLAGLPPVPNGFRAGPLRGECDGVV